MGRPRDTEYAGADGRGTVGRPPFHRSTDRGSA